jgi:hypothetical protein
MHSSARPAAILPQRGKLSDLAATIDGNGVRLGKELAMPGFAPPVADEREGLFAYLELQRGNVRTMAYGLTNEQARSAPSASPLSVGGLVKHLASTERGWTARCVGRERDSGVDDYVAGFTMGPDETLAGLLADYDAAARETDAELGALALDAPVPVGDAPWFPKDVDNWSVRWVLLHLIEETARHVGHMDIVRETVDGGTWYALMAAVDGAPAAPWIQPWRPAGSSDGASTTARS